jgi:hypothetical protein
LVVNRVPNRNQRGADRNRVADLNRDGSNDAGAGSGNLGDRLVSLDLDDRLTLDDAVANAYEDSSHQALGYLQAHLGQYNVRNHPNPFSLS